MANRITFDPEKFNLNIARLKKGGETFEIVVDPDLAISFKEGKKIDLKDILKYEQIFSDAQKGQLAVETLFEPQFHTTDALVIAEMILKTGEIHITAEKRKEAIEQKRNKIITTIQRNCVDPRTSIPHTRARVEMAMNEAKVHVNEFKTVEEQVKEIVHKMKPILPIKFEVKIIEVTLPTQFAHQTYAYVKKAGTLLSDHWAYDQSWTGRVEIPGGMEEEFHSKLNALTKGEVHTKIIETK